MNDAVSDVVTFMVVAGSLAIFSILHVKSSRILGDLLAEVLAERSAR